MFVAEWVMDVGGLTHPLGYDGRVRPDAGGSVIERAQQTRTGFNTKIGGRLSGSSFWEIPRDRVAATWGSARFPATMLRQRSNAVLISFGGGQRAR